MPPAPLRLRPGFVACFLVALTLLAMAPTPAGALSLGMVESIVQRLLGGKPLPTAGPTTDGHVLAYDSTTGRLVWEAQAAGSGDLTEIQETGDALVVASGTGPVPSISAQANVEALADAGTMVAGDLFYATSSTAIARLAKGTADQTLRMNAGATAPEWDTVASGSALFHAFLDPRDGISPPGTSSLSVAAYSVRNGHPCMEFPASEEDSTQDDSVDFIFRVPSNFSTSNNLQVDWVWSAEGATSGDVVWIVEVEAFGPALIDLDSDSFDTAQTVTTTTSGTDGNTVTSSIQFTVAEFDGVAAGNLVRIRLTRNSNEALDTLAVRAQVYGMSVEEEAP